MNYFLIWKAIPDFGVLQVTTGDFHDGNLAQVVPFMLPHHQDFIFYFFD